MKNIISAKETFIELVKESNIVVLKDDCKDILEALNKQIPTLPMETQELMDIEWLCPVCHSKVGDCIKVDEYCRSCGQKILFNK